jgi:hypothetical protein
MMSGVMDPSLELQQLASEALNYQATQLQPQQTQYVTTETYDPDAKYICPFPTCTRHYKRKDLLKRHLTTLHSSRDEHHQDQDIWEHVRESGIMTIFTRPRNLTEDQKKQRRKESNLRHRVKYADELKEKRNRKRRLEKLLDGKQVGVQTPDWDAEARANANLNPGLATALPQVETEIPPPPPSRARRGGRSKR